MVSPSLIIWWSALVVTLFRSSGLYRWLLVSIFHTDSIWFRTKDPTPISIAEYFLSYSPHIYLINLWTKDTFHEMMVHTPPCAWTDNPVCASLLQIFRGSHKHWCSFPEKTANIPYKNIFIAKVLLKMLLYRK